MFTTKQVCDFLGISNTTLRAAWVPEFADHLSEHATPPKGQERRFTAEDVAVLYTIAALRQQAVEFPEIHQRLNAGERLEPPPGSRPPMPDHEEAQATAVTVAAFERALTSYENRLEKLENKLEEAQAARLAAEIRAARLEGELTTLQTIMQAQEAAPAVAAPPPTLAAAIRAWWQSRSAPKD